MDLTDDEQRWPPARADLKTVVFVAILAILGAFALGACSDEPTPRAEPEEVPDALALETNNSATTTGPRPGRETTLEVVAWKGNEDEPAGLPQLIERFEAENPSVDVTLTYVSRVDSDNVLTRRLREGDAPDVMMTDMPLAKHFADAGQLADLGIDSAWYPRISDDMRAVLTTDEEQIYVMPVEMTGMGNFVNMDLLAQAGIDEVPITVDELLAACGRLADAGIEPLVFSGGFSAPLFLIANGLEGAGAERAISLGLGTTNFVDDPAFHVGIDLISELTDAQCFDPREQAVLDPWSTALTDFKEGRVAMMPQGAWNITSFGQVEDLNFVFAPIPAKEAGVALDVFGFGWSIPVEAEQAEVARAFVDWLALPQQIQTVLDDEAAYTPFDDRSNGTPPIAALFDSSRANGGAVNYPPAILIWPKALEVETRDSLTALLLDPSTTSRDVLERWDLVVREDQE